MKTKKQVFAGLIVALSFALGACDDRTSGEKAGAQIDDAADKASKAIEKAAVKAGTEIEHAAAKATESVDGTLGKLKEEAVKADDAAITTKVKTAISAEPELTNLEINVNTMRGVVTLTGPVNAQASSDKAMQLANAVPGVKQVENKLIVK